MTITIIIIPEPVTFPMIELSIQMHGSMCAVLMNDNWCLFIMLTCSPQVPRDPKAQGCSVPGIVRVLLGVWGSLKKRKDRWTRSLTDLEYSYSSYDNWPGDVATVVLCIFIYPGRHNIRPTYKTSRKVHKYKIVDIQLTNQIAIHC